MYCCVRYNKQNARKDSVLPVIFSCVRGGSMPPYHEALIQLSNLMRDLHAYFRFLKVTLSLSICSGLDLPLSKILEGHYPGTFVSVALYHNAIHSRSRPVSGQCVGDPHGFPALLAIKINRLHSALLPAQKEAHSYPLRV